MKTGKATIIDIQQMVGLHLGKRQVKPSDRFMEDLGAESADLINITAAAEDKYNITFDEAQITTVRTVQELYELIKQTV